VAHSIFLQTERLRYSYRKDNLLWVLADIDVRVESDEFLLVCGPSGSGKSTLCRTFNGLIPHFYNGALEGDIRVAGKSTKNQTVGELFRHVGMVFQDPETQLFNGTVEQEIAFGLESLGLPRREIERRIHESADRVNISDLLPRNPHDLSGGEQQLVSIAAVLAHEPGLIVLDEPYANLDPFHVTRVREILRAVHRSGIGVVICEHRLPYTLPDVHRIVVLEKGRIVSDLPPHDLVALDMEHYGLELPLAARVGKKLGLKPVPLNIDEIALQPMEITVLSDLKPRTPAPMSHGAPSVLAVENISFSIDGKPILRDISFTLTKGECLAVVGANGAGKTVLLKHLNGLNRPSQGRVVVMDKDTRETKVSQLARLIGIAFQNPNNQFFKLTVREEIEVSAKALDCYDPSWIKELVAFFHLEPLLDRAPFRLSGGEKKRVAFAAALAARPAILALDEPTAGQGWYFRRALGRLLTRLLDRGQSLILVTHDLAFAEAYAHRWLVLAEGRVIARGRPGEVMADNRALKRAHLEPTDAHRLWGQ
jgi:energy-coupling factor transport system ATP-binding protein